MKAKINSYLEERISIRFGGRPHLVPANLVQRFGAQLLDIGLLLSLLIAVNILWHLINDIPFERPRYRPPSPDMGWDRIFRSAGAVTCLLAISSAFISSPLRATPGMLAFHLRAAGKAGNPLGFLRTFLWTALAFAPALAANYLVLIGVKLQTPLLHFGLFNALSFLVLLQAIWFLTVFFRRDSLAIPDLICGVRVVYHSEHEGGLKILKKIFHFPFLLIFLALLFVSASIATINLFDQPLDPRIKVLRNVQPDTAQSLFETWRSRDHYDDRARLADYRCISKNEWAKIYFNCRDHGEIKAILEKHAPDIATYKENVRIFSQQQESQSEILMLPERSLTLTDFVLADLIIKYETGAASAEETLDMWLALESYWREVVSQPGFLITQSNFLIHYSHVLSALPYLTRGQSELLIKHDVRVLAALSPIVFDENFVFRIMAYEYLLYERFLESSRIPYLPMIQPNHTRNQFVTLVDAITTLFEEPKSFRSQPEIIRRFASKYRWNVFYNPLGTQFRDYAIVNIVNNIHVVTAYHSNNALKEMLKLYLTAQQKGISSEDFGEYLESLPESERKVLQNIEIQWDKQENSLYYTLPGMDGYRRILPL